jgi:hypothetical protein
VVIQPTGDRICVLKIKPPLCLDTAGADFFADVLDRVPITGWRQPWPFCIISAYSGQITLFL